MIGAGQLDLTLPGKWNGCRCRFPKPIYFMQSTDTVLMVRPANLGYNPLTAASNAFQDAEAAACDPNLTQTQALAEFDNFVAVLQSHGVNVVVAFDTPEPVKPDAIFPNNWVSFHEDGTVVFYPMMAENRRWERRRGIVDLLRDDFVVDNEVDLAHYEADAKFLEGTGSLVLDRDYRVAYACISPRTDAQVLADFAAKTGYRPVLFTATDGHGQQIYHTNVIMCVAKKYAVICLATIRDPHERAQVETELTLADKQIIDITLEQMGQFAGNMLELHNAAGQSLLAMSEQAYRSLRPDQVAAIERFSTLVHAPLYTIEANGGGSARCMLAAVHLPRKSA